MMPDQARFSRNVHGLGQERAAWAIPDTVRDRVWGIDPQIDQNEIRRVVCLERQ